jgi:hypothetical protein
MLGRRKLKRGNESFESPTIESKWRRPNIESPIHLVTETNTENAETPPETTEPQDRNGSRRPQRAIMEVPYVVSYLSVRELYACVAPVCKRRSVLSKRPSLWKELTFASNGISIGKVRGVLRRSPELPKLTLWGRTRTLFFDRYWEQRPCHSSGCWSSASHRGGPGSIPGQLMWDV